MDNLTVELNEAKKSHKKTVNEANAIREREKKQNQFAGEKLGAAHRAGYNQKINLIANNKNGPLNIHS